MFERFHPHCHYQSHENLLHFPNYLTCNVFFFFFFFFFALQKLHCDREGERRSKFSDEDKQKLITDKACIKQIYT